MKGLSEIAGPLSRACGWSLSFETMRTFWCLLRVSYQIRDWSLIGSYLWDQVIMRRKIEDTKTDYFE